MSNTTNDRCTLLSLSLFFPFLFFFQGEGPFPGVIDLFGTAGGILEFRAALLASRGFACLSLPYFRYEDLPDDLFGGIDLEYFTVIMIFFISLRI